MDFSEALRRVKGGEAIQRQGWNGKGMFVVLQKGYPEGIAINSNTANALNLPVGTILRFHPYLMMRTATGDYVPWLASQTDILADDWIVLAR